MWVVRNYLPHTEYPWNCVPVLWKPGTLYSGNHVPLKPRTLYPWNLAFLPEIWRKNRIAHQCLKIKVKPFSA